MLNDGVDPASDVRPVQKGRPVIKAALLEKSCKGKRIPFRKGRGRTAPEGLLTSEPAHY